MDLAHFIMLIHEFLNKDPDIVPEEAPLIILDCKFAMCMAKNGKDTKHNRNIARRMNFVRNGENCKMHNFLHSLQNAFSLQCVWYVWYLYHY